MKRSSINKVSKKQEAELRLRDLIKNGLIAAYGRRCMTCGHRPSFPPIGLSHIIPLSRGGKTSLKNCILEDYNCHSTYEKRPEARPKDSIGYKLWKAQGVK